MGEPFTLHVILTGMSADEPLAFELQSVEWVIHTICCGDSPVGVTSLVHAPGFEVDGDPYEAIASLTDDCPGGDTVLLAPGCASFDMYASYAERGEKFAEAVLRRKEER